MTISFRAVRHCRFLLVVFGLGFSSVWLFGQNTYTIETDGELYRLGYAGGNDKYRDFTIPANYDPNSSFNQITFALRGGDGGRRRVQGICTEPGGKGARVDVSFEIGEGEGKIEPGGTIRIVVGQQGGSLKSGGLAGAGGGGGSAVLYRPPGVTGNGSCMQDILFEITGQTAPAPSLEWDEDCWILLAAAGGGGGAYASGGCAQASSGKPGNAGENGTDGKGTVNDNNGEGGINGRPGEGGEGGDGGGGWKPYLRGGGGTGTENGLGGGITGGEGGDSDVLHVRGGYGYGGGGSGVRAILVYSGGGGGGFSGGGGGGFANGGGSGGSFANSFAVSSDKRDGNGTDRTPNNGYVSYQFENNEELVDAPIAVCEDATVFIVGLDESISAAEVAANSTDPNDRTLTYCFDFDGSCAPNVGFDCFDIGDEESYVVRVDNGILSSTCIVNIEVQQGAPGALICPPTQTINITDCDGVLFDNQTNPGMGQLRLNPDEFPTCEYSLDAFIVKPDGSIDTDFLNFSSQDGLERELFDFGTSQIVYTVDYEDENGVEQTQNCVISITLEGQENFSLNCPNNIQVTVQPGDPEVGQCTVEIVDEPGGFDLDPNYGGCGDLSYTITPQQLNAMATTGMGEIDQFDFPLGISTVEYTLERLPGETYTCSFIVEINGRAIPPPTIDNCPEDVVTIDIYEGITQEEIVAQIDFDVTEVCGIASIDVTELDLSCAEIGFLQENVRITVTNTDGGIDFCRIDVRTREDIRIECPEDITVLVDNGTCNAVIAANLLAPTAQPVCPANLIYNIENVIDNQVVTSGSGEIPEQTLMAGQYQVNYLIQDGNSFVGCSSNIQIIDEEAPAVMCQDATVNLSELPSDVGTLLFVSATDDCSSTFTASTFQTFGCDDIGNNSVLVSVADESGNTSVCTAVLTIIDDVVPEITSCPADRTIVLDENCEAVVPDLTGEIIGMSACGVVMPRQVPEAGTILNSSGIIEVLVDLADEDGQGADTPCSVQVTVADNNAPTALCQDINLNIESDPETIAPADIDNGSNDNCGEVSLSLNRTEFGCADVGQMIVVTLSVSDGTNTTTCTGTVTVTDNTPPFVDCQAGIVNLDADGNGTLLASDLNDNNGSTDACGPLVFSFDEAGLITSLDFECADVGELNDFVYATDANGNVSEPCPVTIFVQDNELPAVNCTNITIQLDVNGEATLTPQQIGSATDNCGVLMEEIDMDEFDCSMSDYDGEIEETVTYTATDINGNSNSCTATVEVEDNIPPVITCLNATFTLQLNPSGVFDPLIISASDLLNTYEDNCFGMSVVVQQFEFSDGCDDLGEHELTISIADLAGNAGTCVSTVTIIEETTPDAVCQNVEVTLDESGMGSVTVDEVDNGSTDECLPLTFSFAPDASVASIDYDCDDAGTSTEITLYVTDESGNTGTCNATVSVVDNTSPDVSCFPAMVTMPLDVPASGEVTIFAQQVFQQVSDNCPLTFSLDPIEDIPSITYTCEDLGEFTLQAYATDAGGNTSTCALNVRVGSQVLISCNTNITIPLSQAALSVSDMVNGATDACFPDEDLIICFRGLTIDTGGDVCTEKALTCADLGVNQYIATASNANGDASSCVVEVTVLDDVPPVALCQDISVALANGMVEITPEQVDNGSNDEGCGMVTLSLDQTSFDCEDVGDNPVVLTVTDENSNSSTCNATVTVTDEVPILFFELPDVCQFDLSIDGVLGGATPVGGVYSGTGVTDDGNGETFSFVPDQAGDFTVTYTYTTDGGCVFTTSTTLTVVDCAPEITDPCACNEDASPVIFDPATGTYDNPNDGTFSEVVTIMAGTEQEFRVTAVSGALGINIGAVFTDAGGGDYTLSFDHADDIGYSLTAFQFIGGVAIGGPLIISNKCAYPNPVFDPELEAIYCNFEESILLGATDTDGIGADEVSFTVNGTLATSFDPDALGAGTYVIEMIYDGAADANGGISPDGGTSPAFPGCSQAVQTTVVVERLEVGCLANLNVSLDEQCSATITPDMVLTGTFGCADEIVISVDGSDSDVLSGCGDHTYEVEIFVSGEMVYTCWGEIFAEDVSPPMIECQPEVSTATNNIAVFEAEGELTATGPTINFSDYSCTSVPGLLDGEHPYEVFTFTTGQVAPALSVYAFFLSQDLVGGIDDGAQLFLFQGDFNPDNPCENIVGSTANGELITNFDPFTSSLFIELLLASNQQYTLVVTNNDPLALGEVSVAMTSLGILSISLEDFRFVRDLDYTGDLICNDINRRLLEQPVSYVASTFGDFPDIFATRDLLYGGDLMAAQAAINPLFFTRPYPVVSDNCARVIVTVSDEVISNGDCGDVLIERTFVASEYEGDICSGVPLSSNSCTQILRFRKPTVEDVILPPQVITIECDQSFETDGSVGGPDDNPIPAFTGAPHLRTGDFYEELYEDGYCNLGVTYSDEPRIEICEGSYTFRREWTIIDWCDPGNTIIFDQLVKVGDFTGPIISGVSEVINLSTSPFACVANVAIPNPGVVDGNACGSAAATTYTILAGGETFFAGGFVADGDVVQVPIGEHVLIICAEDACGNETCEEYDLIVTDEIEPTASCDDELNVSIGGGDVLNGIEGIARLFAEDVDEGSSDNCGEVTLEVRRNYWRNNTCDASANRWSPWGDFVDFYCCDIANEITIELRVTDESGNTNTCWMTVTPEDKLNPYCYEPADVSLTCNALPLTFPGDIEAAYDEDFAGTSIMMSALFGNATGTDNCAVDTIVERTPNIQINECGWGSITRRFEAWQLKPEGDVNGNGAIDINEVNRSTNSCSQLITITEVHDFVIDFPQDADADCGDPDVPTIATETDGCDVLSINIGDPVIFSATGDECYKYSITYDVINWCLWDGEYTGHVLPRMTEDDGESLPIDRAVEANERPIVIYNDADGLIIDRDHERPVNRPDFGEEEGRWFVNNGGDSSIPNNAEFDGTPNLPNYGRYIYTQFVKVYDSTAPEVAVGEYGGPTENCPDLLPGQFGDDDGDCQEAVSIPFSVSDECELFDNDGNLVITIVSAELDAFAVDANGDGEIKANEFSSDADATGYITDNGDGTYSFDGVFPIITSEMGDNVVHAVRILFEDGCGNQTSEIIEFDVIDCKGPAPICINGLTVTLMPQDDGSCAMAIWASDFEGSPIYDCTGQGPETNAAGQLRVTSYAIYRAADVEADPDFEPNPADTGLVLTQDDDETTVIYVYAFDEEGNYDYCETYVLVQAHVSCGEGTGTISGVIMTEEDEAVEGVEVNLNGSMSTMMMTGTDGAYNFNTLMAGGDYSVTPHLNANPLNGVTTFDLIKISQHVLNVELLDSPYKMIAADANRSNTITTLDMIQIRKLILNIITEFPNNTSWRFVEQAYGFPDMGNPWLEGFPELINVNNLPEVGVLDADFVGVKIGDVNGSVQANALAGDDRNLNGQFNFAVESEALFAGNIYTVAFRGADMEMVEGFQGTLKLQGAELVDIEYGVATAENFGTHPGLPCEGRSYVTMSWNGKATSEDVLFSLVIRATEDIDLSAAVSVNSRYTAAEAYGNGNTMDVGVVFSRGDVVDAGFELYQNTPNPFQSETMISFNLPEDGEVTLTVNDAAGRVLTIVRGDYAAGYNTINLTKSQMQGASGVLSYTVSTAEYTATKSMIAVK